MRELEERFITLGLPYRVIGGPRFYERQEIRDALAYFRVIVSPADGLAFERIVNVPKRGLGDTTMQMLHDYARQHEVPLLEAARVIASTDELKPKPRTSLRDLIAQFDRWRSELEKTPHTELARIVLDESGYTEMWKNDKSAQAAGRLENLKELVRSMEQFENMQGFLEHVSLVMDTIEGGEVDAVNLMTLHSAKGLEFDTVFLPGWEEGILPHQRSLDESGQAGLEEERRLAHVGLTRAKQRAYISYASRRLTHGMWNSNLKSRFLDELPEEHIEMVDGGGSYAAQIQSRFDRAEPFTSGYSTPGWQRAQQQRRGGFSDKRRGYNRGPATIEGEILARSSGPAAGFEIGDRVFHEKFGYGEIMEVEGTKVIVEFDKAGEKKLVASFLKKV
jgi:DNA helicase-2/ATP-dependent DNA helicase PcrA